MNMKNRIVAVVVTFNRKELLYECLTALTAQSVPNDILIIDNGSTDHTKEHISSFLEYENVCYCNAERNLGGAGGFNLGMKKAAERGYEYIWIMDDDTIPEQNALEELLKADCLLKGTYGFLASDVLWIDGTACLMNVPGVSKNYLEGDNNRYLEKGLLSIRHASFVSAFFPGKIVREAGLPIKEFFIWNDDYEYTTRISRKYNCYYVPRSRVIHKMKKNIKTNIVLDTPDRVGRYRYSYRNSYYTARKEGAVEIIKYYFNVLTACFNIIRSNCPAKIKRLKTVLQGVFAGWFFRPKVELVSKNNKDMEL